MCHHLGTRFNLWKYKTTELCTHFISLKEEYNTQDVTACLALAKGHFCILIFRGVDSVTL